MKEGIYIYCFVPDFYQEEMFSLLVKHGISRIPGRKISALVSGSGEDQVDYKDRELLGKLVIRHQMLIEEIRATGFIHLLPVKPGTVAGSEEEVLKIMHTGHRLINDTFKKMQFLTEMDLAVSWTDFPSTLNSITEAAREEAAGSETSDEHSLYENNSKNWSIVKNRLCELSQKAELSILDHLLPVCLDIKPHESMNYQMISNSAFLINRSDTGEFEDMIKFLDIHYKGALTFRLIGPLPCYSFFTVEVEELTADRVARANIELGLKHETSEDAIKRAYLKKAKMFHPDMHLRKGEEDYFNSITKAYHTLLDYSSASKQSHGPIARERGSSEAEGRMILVKLKE
jgi:hypothetical protein